MAGFLALKGQNAAVASLGDTLIAGRIAHAYLFTGPRGVGKRLGAEIFARALICEAEQQKPCDICLSCHKNLNGNHPDVFFIEPDGSSFKIEQVRALQKRIHTMAYEGKHKVFIIDDAHKATLQASNSLLRVLEEPPEGCIFILITDNPHALPATVLSRCQRVNFAPLDKKILLEVLMGKGYSEQECNLVIELALGSASDALDLLNNQKLSQTRELALDFLNAAFTKDHFKRFKLIESLEKEKIETGLFQEQLIMLLRDVYMLRKGGSNILNRDLATRLESLPIGVQGVQNSLKYVLEAGELLRKQANNKLLFDVLGSRIARLA